MKGISQTKDKILELLWENETPTSVKEVSVKVGLKGQSANMHLLGLAKLGYVSKSDEGHYTITESGKEAIGFTKIDENLAKKILGKTTPEKVFHFYSGIGQPTGVSSNSLADFCQKIKTVDLKSIEFHMARGDFEKWISSLGDTGLAKRLRLIQEAGLKGEALRERVHKSLRTRCDELLKK